MNQDVKTSRLEFENSDGLRLSGLLEHPAAGDPVAFGMFAHCFTCSKDYKAVGNIARTLAANGIAVLRFDFTGLGESEGEFADTTFSSNVSDLIAAADYLGEHYRPPRLLMGHSLGGTAVLRAAGEILPATAVVTIASPFDPSNLRRLVTGKRDRLEREGEVEVSIGGRPFTIKQRFIDDIETTEMEESIGNMRKALLVMHSPDDPVVPIKQASLIFGAARHPKSFVSLDGADHLLSNRHHARYAAGVIAAWLSHYLDPE